MKKIAIPSEDVQFPSAFKIHTDIFGRDYYFVLAKSTGNTEVSRIRIDSVSVTFESDVVIKVYEFALDNAIELKSLGVPYMLTTDTLPETPEEAVEDYANSIKKNLLEEHARK